MPTKKRIASIIKRNGNIVPFDKERITNAIYKAALETGISERKIAESLSDKVVEKLLQTYPPKSIPSVEEIQDIVEEVLIEEGQSHIAKNYILYRYEHTKLREGREKYEDVSDNVPYKKIWKALVWAIDNDIHSIKRLNKHIRKGTMSDLIMESERAYHKDLDDAAMKILERQNELRIVIIAGPSSSGKTTTTIKISERLKKHNIDLIAMNLDNYYFDLEMHPKDEFGDYDFETPWALDLKLINEHLSALLEGKTIQMPIYDFKVGERIKETKSLRLEDNQLLLLDSLHGLYAEMTKSIPADTKFKLYIETLLQMKNKQKEFIRWTDIRLLRRMIRDSWSRKYSPQQTLEHWHYVRRSELQHIVPFIETVDHIVNSALPYELAIYRHKLFHFFPEFVKNYKDDPLRFDAYVRAKRVHDLLKSINPWEDLSVISDTSLIREFVGGSKYKY